MALSGVTFTWGVVCTGVTAMIFVLGRFYVTDILMLCDMFAMDHYPTTKWLTWLVQVNDVKELWRNQPTYILSQASFLLGGFITLIHAFKQGGRWPWFWLATVLHGLWTDNVWHFLLPEMDNFWHSQTPVMLLGSRMPLHIIFLYPTFLYTAAVAVSRLRLPLKYEMFAVALLTVAIDLPYDIVSVKFVHWTWHASDPNIFDRLYYVPWNSLYFHSTFAASLYGIFHGVRRWMAPDLDRWQSAGFKAESRALVLASLLGMPGGVVMFAVLYHPLHDGLDVHSEVTFFALASIFVTFVLLGLFEHVPPVDKTKSKVSKTDCLLLGSVLVHYGLFWSLAVWGSPEHEVSTGLHQTVGPCDKYESLTTPFGQTLWKGKYLCLEDHGEEYFDFHCVDHQAPADYSNWYTICGTPFDNRPEYITLISAISFISLVVLFKLISRGREELFRPVPPAKKGKKNN